MNEGKDIIILDYGTMPPHWRLKKWLCRLLWACLVMASLVAMPLSWLLVGWQAEQGPIRRIEINGGKVYTKVVPAPVLSRFLPRRLQWLEERVTIVELSPSQGESTLKDLKSLTNLKWIGSYRTQVHTRVMDAGLVYLAGLTNLQYLDLSVTNVTDGGLVHLKGLTNLKYLDLYGSKVTDGGLLHLKGLTNLQDLNLSGTKVTNGCLVHLKGLTNLQRLSLCTTQVTDDGLVHLRGLTNLQDLFLSGTRVTDKGLVHLAGLTNLRCLSLCNMPVTDEGLVHLQRLTKLRGLYLSGTQVTKKGATELQRALPSCLISR